ncbi:hypothetical protein LEP1GSC035_0393 [Leptospira noguchii str. 2007001578]|uniref:Lipoprotein n=2 Tax=Leptospira noguchii TaxID=28182 RepID=M6YBL0_9LEPT|nr:hypothetical protein LEP1GSC035_0393 [Leptospira noguchii str. 2007001578]EMO89251.1 hypothetical protein LEP1GSC024_3971 [Leptospira noguchii str. 2001034031]
MPLSLKKSVQKITYFLLGCGNSRFWILFFLSCPLHSICNFCLNSYYFPIFI